jgi:chromosome partitioning protein
MTEIPLKDLCLENVPVKEKNQFTTTEILRIFNMEDPKGNNLINAESRGEIPKAERIKRGKVDVRVWKTEDLPLIGKKFGYLKKPKKQVVLSIYAPKGGVLKTTLTKELARSLALNGLKVLVVGLESQRSITKIFLKSEPATAISEIDARKKEERPGLYDFFYRNTRLQEVIQETDLPNLNFIPETVNLIRLEKEFSSGNASETQLKKKLLPELTAYDVVIFDNGSGFNKLTANSLNAAEYVVMPLGCEEGAYEALADNMELINDYRQELELKWKDFIMVPTLSTQTSLSEQIKSNYISSYVDSVIPYSIRSTVTGQEANFNSKSVCEYAPSHELTKDYHKVLADLWRRVLTHE